MNKKIEALIKLREVVAQQEELAIGHYVAGECKNCVIGHLLKVGGATNEQLIEIDEGKYKIDDSDETAYAIHTILEMSQQYDIVDNFVQGAIEKLGFDIHEDDEMLNELQAVNDYTSGKKEAVIEKIDYFINELQKEAV